MIFMKQKWLLQIFAFLYIVSLTITLIVPVYATNSVDSLEQSSSDLENELSGFQNELKALSSEITSITEQISEITEEITQTKAELAIAKGEEEAQYETMKKRIRYIYENGNNNFLEILLSSASFADFLRRAELFSTLTEYDNAQLEKLVETQENISAREEYLASEQEHLYMLQKDLNQKEKQLTEKISNTSAELTQVTAQLAKAREEAKKAEDALKQEVVPVPPQKEEPKKEEPKKDTLDNSTSDEDTTDKNETNPPTQNGNDNDTDNNIAATVSDIELFAALIECEAGSTDYEGMLAVASVVVNRMNHPSYPDTLRGVIYQAGQFPPAHDGKVDRVLKRGVKDSCVQVANDALAGKNNVGDCLNFRSASSGHVGTVIGDNVFF